MESNALLGLYDTSNVLIGYFHNENELNDYISLQKKLNISTKGWTNKKVIFKV